MTLTARFEGGMCPAGCGSRIHIGDAIRKDEDLDAFVHDECAPKPDPYTLGPNEIVCGSCWLVKPCRCDE